MKISIEIRLWGDASQPDDSEMAELLGPHVNHVADQLTEGYTSGQIFSQGKPGVPDLNGWWEIKS
jgi:hypothetical protein